MERTPSEPTVWALIDIGNQYARIGQIKAGRRLGPTRTDRLGFLYRIRDFCLAIETLGLPKPKQLAEKLQKGRLEELDKALEKYAEATLYYDTAVELKIELTRLWDKLTEEASKSRIYIARPFIWEEPFARFIDSPRTFLNLEKRGRYEKEWPEEFDENLAEAARCLSVSFWAGTLLFTIRAIDVSIKHYFQLTTTELPGRDPWGKLCDRLEQFDTPDELIQAVRRLKNEYRDPMAHTVEEKLTFDEDNTLDVLTRSASVMSHMVRHLLSSQRIVVVDRTLSPETVILGQ